MAGFREDFIKRSAAWVGKWPTHRLLNRTGQSQVLPFYHAISDEPLAHIRHLYKYKNKTQFLTDLEELLAVFKPIDLFEFQEIANGSRANKEPAFLLSFDDGLREFYDVIAPILLQKGIPAICFLNSKFVDNQQLFFRYKASLLIDALKNNPGLTKIPEVKAWQKSVNQELEQEILGVKYSNQIELDKLANIIELDFDKFLKVQQPYLTTHQIDKLITQGFQFGAHSVDHPEYRLISQSEQIQQTQSSVNWIVDKFDLKYKAFSFPFTDFQVEQSFFDEIASQQIADITFGGAGQKNESIPFHFQRMPLEIADLSAKQIINSELLYYLLKAPFGKNMMRRT